MRGRVDAVGAAGEHRHRRPRCGERGAVRHRVNPVRRPGNDGAAARHGCRGELGSDVGSVVRAGACANDRERGSAQAADGAPKPEHVGRVRPQVAELPRPGGVRRGHDADAQCERTLDIGRGLRAGEPGTPSTQRRGHDRLRERVTRVVLGVAQRRETAASGCVVHQEGERC